MQKRSILTFLQNNRLFAYVFGFTFLVIAILLGVGIGSVPIPLSTIWDIVLMKLFNVSPQTPVPPMIENILFQIRLPRVILAGLVGGSLAISGAAFQGLLKNPLADPYTLGISSGASLGAVVVIYFGITISMLGSFTLPIISILMGFLTMLLVLIFAQLVQRSMATETIILTGIIVGYFFSAFISLLIALTGEELRQIIIWLMGSVAMRGWDYTFLVLPFFIIGTLLLLFNSSELNAMSFGEERAQSVGVDVRRRKMLILIAASILTGASVAATGVIGFVGLVIPHMVRTLFGVDHRHLLPLSILIGSGFLILADLVARTIIAPTELPIGVVTALIGAPVFAVILYQQRMERGKKNA